MAFATKPHLEVGERSMGMGSGVGGGGVGAMAGVGAGSAALAVEAAAAGSMASSSSAGRGGKGISPAQSAGGAGGLIRLRRGQQTDRRKYSQWSIISPASNVRLRTDCRKKYEKVFRCGQKGR